MLYLHQLSYLGRYLRNVLIHLHVLQFLVHRVVVYLHNERLHQVYRDHMRELHRRFQPARLYFQIRVFPCLL